MCVCVSVCGWVDSSYYMVFFILIKSYRHYTFKKSARSHVSMHRNNEKHNTTVAAGWVEFIRIKQKILTSLFFLNIFLKSLLFFPFSHIKVVIIITNTRLPTLVIIGHKKSIYLIKILELLILFFFCPLESKLINVNSWTSKKRRESFVQLLIN